MTGRQKAHLIILPIFITFLALLIFNPTIAFFVFVGAAMIVGIIIFYFIIIDGIADHFDQKKRDAEWKQRQKELNEKWDLINKRAPRTDE